MRATEQAYPLAERLIDFGDGFAWWNLGQSSCAQEASAMGHCGNIDCDKPGDRILSLRKRVEGAGEITDTPFLTFVLDSEGRLGEMKGRGNKEPAARYHKYIVPLLLSAVVTGIKGLPYHPANNFALTDLSEEQRAEILAEKPALFTRS